MASATVVRDLEGKVALVTGATSGIGRRRGAAIPIGLIETHERKPVVEYSDLTATVVATSPCAGSSPAPRAIRWSRQHGLMKCRVGN